MYQLISVTRDELDVTESRCKTHKEAHEAMIADIILSTGYESLDEIKEAAERGECELNDNSAWAETSQYGTGQWNIVEIKEDGISKERLIQIIQDYVGNDYEAASEPGYVRDVLTDVCGCDTEELKELGLYDWLGFDEEEDADE